MGWEFRESLIIWSSSAVATLKGIKETTSRLERLISLEEDAYPVALESQIDAV